MEYGIVNSALTGVAWAVEQAEKNPTGFSVLAAYFVLSKLFFYYYGTKILSWGRKKLNW